MVREPNTRQGVLARSQFWSQLRVSARAVLGVSSRCRAWSRTPSCRRPLRADRRDLADWRASGGRGRACSWGIYAGVVGRIAPLLADELAAAGHHAYGLTARRAHTWERRTVLCRVLCTVQVQPLHPVALQQPGRHAARTTSSNRASSVSSTLPAPHTPPRTGRSAVGRRRRHTTSHGYVYVLLQRRTGEQHLKGRSVLLRSRAVVA